MNHEQLQIERVSMFGLPYASNIVSDANSSMIVAYSPDQVFSNDLDVQDYYLVGDSGAAKEIILVGVDTQGPENGQVVPFTTADLPTLHRVEKVQISKETKLVFVLAESIHSKGRARYVYILNKTLARDLNARNPSQRGGLIFVLDMEVISL